MPKTRFQSVVFTAITAWMMVYCMTLYNTVLATGAFTNKTFLYALRGMWLEYLIIFLCAFFIAGHVAKYFAFRVVQPGDRPIFIIFAIQTFTVITQVFFASIIATIKIHGFTYLFLPQFLTAYCINFIMALPLQLIIAGPLARLIFRSIFLRTGKKAASTQDIQNLNQVILNRMELSIMV